VPGGFHIDPAADQTRLTNRLRDALSSISPARQRAVGSRVAHGGVRDLLAKYPTLTSLKTAGNARVVRTIKTRSPRLAAKVGKEIQAALAAQTVTVPAEQTIGRVISDLVVEVDRVFSRRDKLAAEIEEVFLAHPLGRLLQTLPGIGPRTGSRILAEIGDANRFDTGDKLASYAGLAPVTRQSGKSINGESKSRRGNHRLKNAMFLAAFASLRSPDSKAFYDRKRAEGKRHNAALICLARRRCNVILAMLRTGESYRAGTSMAGQTALPAAT
jgi:transposase